MYHGSKKEFFFTYFKIVLLLLEFETGIGSGNVLEKRWRVFADDGLCVVAANVVPLDAILVDVVEDAKAGLGCLVDFKLGVVWLRFLKVTSGAPGLISPAGRFLIGASEFDTRARPEPAIDNERLKIFSVASLEVAQTTARPNVRQFLLFENAEDHVVLFDSLNANGVHAVLTAQVASVEPIALDVFVLGDVAAQKVPVTVALPLLGSVSAGLGFWKG